MANELATQENSGSLVVREMSVVEVEKRRKKVMEISGKLMKKDVHYGVIPSCAKPCLFKPGAEMLLSAFGVVVKPIEVIDLSTDTKIRYRITMGGYTFDGILVGTGVGEASSNEDKFQWRTAVCDKEYEVSADNQRRIKFKKYYGKIQEIKQIRTNPDDIGNTVLKFAKKRGHIDLTLSTLAVSDVYTQDVEDLPPEYINPKGEEAGRVPFEVQAEREKERLAKKELREQGIVDADYSDPNPPVEPSTLPNAPKLDGEPLEEAETPAREPKTPQDKCGLILQYAAEISGQDKAPDKILEWSAFVKDGKSIPGKSNPFDLSPGRITVVYGKAKTEYYAWKKGEGK